MQQYGAMLLRLVLGVIFLMHAYLALFKFGPSGMIDYQTKQGIPFPQIATWYTILAHGLGGICLLLGLLARLAALVNLPVMLGALFFVHLKNGFWGFNNGYEYVLVVAVATVAQALLGPGAFTLKK